MSRPFHAFLLLASLLCLPTSIWAQDADDVVNVGSGAASSTSVNSLTIQGENIYLDGVLQKEKYKPGMDIVIRDGKAVVVPRDPAAEARKSADKAARKAADKAAREREKEALKAQLKSEKEALKSEALSGVEKGTTRVETGAVVNKGGTVRIGDKVYHDPKPGSDADIPPETRKLIENARRLNQ